MGDKNQLDSSGQKLYYLRINAKGMKEIMSIQWGQGVEINPWATNREWGGVIKITLVSFS